MRKREPKRKKGRKKKKRSVRLALNVFGRKTANGKNGSNLKSNSNASGIVDIVVAAARTALDIAVEVQTVAGIGIGIETETMREIIKPDVRAGPSPPNLPRTRRMMTRSRWMTIWLFKLSCKKAKK